MKKATLKLFKAIPVISKKKKKPLKSIMEKTIPLGFTFSPEIFYNYNEASLIGLIEIVKRELGISGEQMNASLHKSWKKIKDASMAQLVVEQFIHYITTYGFESMGIYSDDTIYIPKEKLEITEIELSEIRLTVIKGYTKDEIKEKLLKLLSSGIALKEDTLALIRTITESYMLKENEISQIKNKEMKMFIYNDLNKIPKNNIEFVRFLIYSCTGKTLLIKNSAVIEGIKEAVYANSDLVYKLLKDYMTRYGLAPLAEIFHRFKPIFLAMRTDPYAKPIVNKIRKLADKYHKPMKEDFLNNVTGLLSQHKDVPIKKLRAELLRVNTFRKIRLAYALKFRTKDYDSIVYKIRNGKTFVKDFTFDNQDGAKKVLEVVLESVVEDISKNVEGKKIYIPDFIKYPLPATEKQFTGNFPSGTCIEVDKNMIFGIHWENLKDYVVDLDLSLMNNDLGKIGWDASYRNKEQGIFFSGDVTSAPRPKGASELFYVKKNIESSYLLYVNYFNFSEDNPVPYKILVGEDEPKNFKLNYMVDPNNVKAVAPTTIDKRQMILGLVKTTSKKCRFYFTESAMGDAISSSNDDKSEKTRKFFTNFFTNMLTLNSILEKAGAVIITDPKDAVDIDLSPEALEKDTIINILAHTS